MDDTWKIGLGVFAFAAALTVGGLIVRTCQHAANIADTPGQIAEQTFSAENTVYNYEWFKRQSQAIEAQKKEIASAQKSVLDFERQMEGLPRSKWSSDDKKEYDMRVAIRDGLAKTCLAAAAEYNSRAQMATRSVFMQGVPATVSCD